MSWMWADYCIVGPLPWSGSSRKAESGRDVFWLERGYVSQSECSRHHRPAGWHLSSTPSQHTPHLCLSVQLASPGWEDERNEHFTHFDLGTYFKTYQLIVLFSPISQTLPEIIFYACPLSLDDLYNLDINVAVPFKSSTKALSNSVLYNNNIILHFLPSGNHESITMYMNKAAVTLHILLH